MGYAIMQKELVVPSLDQIKRAFTVLPTLTELDAQTVAHDAYGILMRGLDLEQASLLQAALRNEKVESEVVEELRLPAIPTARIVRQAEFQPDHLKVWDPMRRETHVAWRDIMFLAAGLVRVREKHTVRELETVGGTRSKEGTAEHMMLDLFLNGGLRFGILAADFSFDCLGDGRSDDRATNFVGLVKALSQHAPDAGLNRGAFLACQETPELLLYPSKQTFNEELTWMLWRIGQIERDRGAGI